MILCTLKPALTVFVYFDPAVCSWLELLSGHSMDVGLAQERVAYSLFKQCGWHWHKFTYSGLTCIWSCFVNFFVYKIIRILQGCRFSIIFGPIRSLFSPISSFIFCETARTHRFSVIFAKVQWHPWFHYSLSMWTHLNLDVCVTLMHGKG